MKCYVFIETYGDYDSSSTSILAVLRGPNKVDFVPLRNEYSDYLERYGADLKAYKLTLEKKERRKIKHTPLSFHDWLVENDKGFVKTEFEEYEY